MTHLKAGLVFLTLFLFGNLFFGVLALVLDLKDKHLAIYMISASAVLGLILTSVVSKKVTSAKKKQLFRKR